MSEIGKSRSLFIVMANKEKKTSKKDKKKAKDSKELRYYRVTEDHDGALVCNCPEFDKTGKPCVEILAARLQIEFGPSKAYFGLPTAADSEDDNVLPAKAKSKGKKQRAGSGPGRRGQRAPADHRVEEVHNAFLERVEKGWNPFGNNQDFTDTEDEGQPQQKKSKLEDKDDEAVGSKVTPGRPAATTPLHTGRSSASPAKFSGKRGPKGKGKNSVLPPLSLAAKQTLLESIAELENPDDDDAPELPLSRPPVINEATLKKKAIYIHNLESDFTPEDLDILDIDWKRWSSDAYKLRQDEAMEMATLLQALSLGFKSGIIVLGPTYEREAELLRHTDWLISDEEPIDTSGAILFPEGGVLKQAWLHSQHVPATEMLVFHHDPDRDHWLLFHANLETEEITCHEPLAQHGEDMIDVRNIVLIAKFFKPNRSASKPVRLIFHQGTHPQQFFTILAENCKE
ncbi:hypothetical protein C8F04DRAFT_1173879 [Mycena alexandri]|uniref:SWIM-type domain-containing protein n=1 Tax=Mycena alexandri TaxID=1745969 RepID=A0AAD6TJ68_9AGAR|nr:hypothetical protein C8F04DRAFT_1173879 [Mycena alexandri]